MDDCRQYMPVFRFPEIIKNIGLDVSCMTNRQKIEVVEWVLGRGDNIADKLPVRNFIYAGMYARELTIPAGVALTGKIHLEDHLCFVTKGDLSIMTDDGTARVQNGHIFEARAGLKKLGFAHEETVFVTVHATKLTNIDDLEAALMSDGDIKWVNDLMAEGE